MAPIVINQVNRMAVQVVLTGADMPVRAVLTKGE
jgi:flagellar assembly factor FliW